MYREKDAEGLDLLRDTGTSKTQLHKSFFCGLVFIVHPQGEVATTSWGSAPVPAQDVFSVQPTAGWQELHSPGFEACAFRFCHRKGFWVRLQEC